MVSYINKTLPQHTCKIMIQHIKQVSGKYVATMDIVIECVSIKLEVVFVLSVKVSIVALVAHYLERHVT